MDSTTTDIYRLKPLHLGISVPDIEASIAWYRDMFGFSVEKRMYMERANAKIVFIKQGDFRIELFEVAGAEPIPESRRYPNTDIAVHGTKHLAFEVQDLRTLMEELKKNGVDVASDVHEIEDTIMAFIRDNSGALIELIQYLDR
jgi:methylmalonyl-CoA/ethylmalonyl-CoA epimerase